MLKPFGPYGVQKTSRAPRLYNYNPPLQVVLLFQIVSEINKLYHNNNVPGLISHLLVWNK